MSTEAEDPVVRPPATGSAVKPTRPGASPPQAAKSASGGGASERNSEPSAIGAVAATSRAQSQLPNVAPTAVGRPDNAGETVAASGGGRSAGGGTEPPAAAMASCDARAAASSAMQQSFEQDMRVREELDSARLRVSSLIDEIERERHQRKDGSFERSATSQLPSLRSAMGGRRRAICERRTLKVRRMHARRLQIHRAARVLPAPARSTPHHLPPRRFPDVSSRVRARTRRASRAAPRQGHVGKIYSLHWAGDSTRLVSASQDGMLIIWDCVRGEQWMSVSLRSAWVMCAAFEQARASARATREASRTMLGLRARTRGTRAPGGGVGGGGYPRQSRGEQIASGGLDDIVSIHNAKQKSQGMVGAVGMRAAIELCGHNSYIAASRFLDPYRWEREIARARDLRIIGRNAGAGHT